MMHLGDAKVRQQIVQRIASLRPDTPRRWGKMTAGQMVCHLDDSFKVALGLKVVTRKSALLESTILKWAALYVPLPMPRGYPTPHELDQDGGGTAPGGFAADRASLVASIERFSDPNRRIAFQPHPVFGALSDRQWPRGGYLPQASRFTAVCRPICLRYNDDRSSLGIAFDSAALAADQAVVGPGSR
jgi:hypothetical protein